jgi:hypothetical protein
MGWLEREEFLWAKKMAKEEVVFENQGKKEPPLAWARMVILQASPELKGHQEEGIQVICVHILDLSHHSTFGRSPRWVFMVALKLMIQNCLQGSWLEALRSDFLTLSLSLLTPQFYSFIFLEFSFSSKPKKLL